MHGHRLTLRATSTALSLCLFLTHTHRPGQATHRTGQACNACSERILSAPSTDGARSPPSIMACMPVSIAIFLAQSQPPGHSHAECRSYHARSWHVVHHSLLLKQFVCEDTAVITVSVEYGLSRPSPPFSDRHGGQRLPIPGQANSAVAAFMHACSRGCGSHLLPVAVAHEGGEDVELGLHGHHLLIA